LALKPLAHLPVAFARVGLVVVVREDGPRALLGHQPPEDLQRPPALHAQGPAQGPQAAVQLLEPGVDELHPGVVGVLQLVEDVGVEDEQQPHAVAVRQQGVQPGVVFQAQVAAKPEVGQGTFFHREGDRLGGCSRGSETKEREKRFFRAAFGRDAPRAAQR